MYDQSEVARVVSLVREAVQSRIVLNVAEHFAGYFDELGITVTVESHTSEEQVILLKDRAAAVLSQQKLPFKWLVTFKRGGKTFGVLFPDGTFAK